MKSTDPGQSFVEPVQTGVNAALRSTLRTEPANESRPDTPEYRDEAGNRIVFHRNQIVPGKLCLVCDKPGERNKIEAEARDNPGSPINLLNLGIHPSCFIRATELHPNGMIKVGEVEMRNAESYPVHVGSFDEEGLLQSGRVEIRERGVPAKIQSRGEYDKRGRVLKGTCLLKSTGQGHPVNASGTFAYASDGFIPYVVEGKIEDSQNRYRTYTVIRGNEKFFEGYVDINDTYCEVIRIDGALEQKPIDFPLTGLGDFTVLKRNGNTLKGKLVTNGGYKYIQGEEKNEEGEVVFKGKFYAFTNFDWAE